MWYQFHIQKDWKLEPAMKSVMPIQRQGSNKGHTPSLGQASLAVRDLCVRQASLLGKQHCPQPQPKQSSVLGISCPGPRVQLPVDFNLCSLYIITHNCGYNCRRTGNTQTFDCSVVWWTNPFSCYGDPFHRYGGRD